MSARDLSVRKTQTWDGTPCRLLSRGPILVEIINKPESGFGFLLASHPSDQRRNIRWYVDRVEGVAINGNTVAQVVESGSYLQLFPDFKNPRPEQWNVRLSPAVVEVGE